LSFVTFPSLGLRNYRHFTKRISPRQVEAGVINPLFGILLVCAPPDLSLFSQMPTGSYFFALDQRRLFRAVSFSTHFSGFLPPLLLLFFSFFYFPPPALRFLTPDYRFRQSFLSHDGYPLRPHCVSASPSSPVN